MRTLLLLVVSLWVMGCTPSQSQSKVLPTESTEHTGSLPTPTHKNTEVDSFTIVTAIPALGSIAQELIKGTQISLKNGLEGDITLDEYENYYLNKEHLLDSLAQSADAVLTLRSSIPEDMLYLRLRQRNIRVVEIDCASPDNPVIGAIGKIYFKNTTTNPYMWLAPTNALRMAEIVSSDLSSLFPSQQKQISSNLKQFKKSLLTLKLHYDSLYLTLPHFDVAVMDNNFDYLLKDIDLYVVQEYPQEIDWDSTITTQFTTDIRNKRFATVVHQWEPSGEPLEIA